MKGSRTATILLVIALITFSLGAKLIPRGIEKYREVDLVQDEALPMKRQVGIECFGKNHKSCEKNEDCKGCEEYANCKSNKCVLAAYMVMPLPAEKD